MIIITVTYPPNKNHEGYSKDFIITRFGDNIHQYVTGKLHDGRITHVVVKNGESIIWDSDRKEDWF